MFKNHKARHRRMRPSREKSAEEMSAYYADLVAKYPLVSIEDPLVGHE